MSERYVCRECGEGSLRWFGRCPGCGEWSSAVTPAEAAGNAAVIPLDRVSQTLQWMPTGSAEVDRVLSGGVAAGSVVVLAGEPGIGKSTLVLQLLAGVAHAGRSVLLATGEESVDQVALRARRLGVAVPQLKAIATSSLEEVLSAAAREAPALLVVDSIQTMQVGGLDPAPGSVTQVKECAARLVRYAKDTGTAIVLVGHVTKEGAVAGPKTLEHMVDVVLGLDGDRSGTLRLLRVLKNRFGSCDETGVFVMEADGLAPVDDPSSLLLQDRRPGAPGSAVFPGLEGTRPVLVEVQALTTRSPGGQPRRMGVGVDGRRLALTLGVLSERAGIRLHDRDVFVAVPGGVRLREPAGDLALCLALASAASGSPVDPAVVAVGEVGLGGEVRRVEGMQRRLAEAARMGFARAMVPPGEWPGPRGLRQVAVAELADALAAALTGPRDALLMGA